MDHVSEYVGRVSVERIAVASSTGAVYSLVTAVDVPLKDLAVDALVE